MVTCGRIPYPIALFRGFDGFVHEEVVALPASMSGTRSKQASKSDGPAWDSLICSGLVLFSRTSRRKRLYVLIILQLAYANAPICHVVPFGTCRLFALVLYRRTKRQHPQTIEVQWFDTHATVHIGHICNNERQAKTRLE